MVSWRELKESRGFIQNYHSPIPAALGVIRRQSSFASEIGNAESTTELVALKPIPKIISLVIGFPSKRSPAWAGRAAWTDKRTENRITKWVDFRGRSGFHSRRARHSEILYP